MLQSDDTAVQIERQRWSSNPARAAAAADVAERVVPFPFRQAVRALTRCALRTTLAVLRRRIRQPVGEVGRRICFADGTSAEVYRETLVDRSEPSAPAVLVVGFRLRHVHRGWAHALFRLESELNTVLFAGFAGFVSKLWLRHDQDGLYRGIYQWDGAELAVAYVRALWWALALVSEKDSIRYQVLPGRSPDDFLAADIGLEVGVEPGRWWRPAAHLVSGHDHIERMDLGS